MQTNRVIKPAIRYSEAFKIQIVTELERANLTIAEVKRKYGIRGDGTVEQWATETIGPNGLRRLGLSDRRLFVIGETYKVDYNPDRSGARYGFTNAFTFPDGKYVKVGFIDENGIAK